MFLPLPLATIVVAAGIYFVLSSSVRSLRRKLIQKETGVADVPFLGISRPADRKIQGTAVVCGGSIAGLAAARVCHDHFERVIIVEPEAWLVTPEGWKPEQEPMKRTRTRVLQYQSLHVILAFGYMAIEKLFPSLREECQKADILIGSADFKLAPYGHFFDLGDEKSRRALPKTLFATRHGLETLLRRLVIGNKQYPNIEQMVGTVTGVIPSASDPTRLEGVSVRTRDGDETISAALVIDCSGATEAGLTWLRRANFGTAISHSSSDGDYVHPLQQLKTVYDPKIRYSTFQFTITPKLAKRLPIPGGYYDEGAIYNCIPDGRVEPKSIYMMRDEGDTLQLCCGTRGDIEHPKNLNEVLAFAKDIIVDKPIPEWFFQILDDLHEVEDSVTLSHVNLPPLSYIQYHQARNLPDNFIAVGDSVLRVNPIYGHGCSKAILGAVALNAVLRSLKSQTSLPTNFSKLFFETQAAKIDSVWEGTKALDYGYSCTVPVAGETLSNGGFLRWYLRRLYMVSFRDHQAGLAAWSGIQLLAPGIDYFHPGIVLKILWDIWKQPHV